MGYILYIVPDEALASYYSAAANSYNAKAYADRDAGFDLFCNEASILPQAAAEKLDQNCIAAFYDTSRNLFRAYWLLPRSSISKLFLRMSNSVGLIDAGYRGKIMAPVDNIRIGNCAITLGQRIFQLASPDLLPWDEVRIVSEIPGGETLRGTGGFGSTGGVF
jgi:dUTP pyrophosphatase